MIGQFAMKAGRCACVFRGIYASPFWETSSKKLHILKRIRHRLLLHPFFSTKGDETPSKKRQRSFRRKCYAIKDDAQTYFIADKSCLLFSIILKVLSGLEK